MNSSGAQGSHIHIQSKLSQGHEVYHLFDTSIIFFPKFLLRGSETPVRLLNVNKLVISAYTNVASSSQGVSTEKDLASLIY